MKATLFVFAFSLRSLSCCLRHQPLRISLRSAGNLIQEGPPYQFWKCMLIIPRSSAKIIIFDSSISRIEMDWITPNLGVGEFWREGRKISDRSLRANAIVLYRQMMEERTRWFLAQLYANPKEHHHHIELSLCCLPYII